jgi:phage terminase large subunit-like protein
MPFSAAAATPAPNAIDLCQARVATASYGGGSLSVHRHRTGLTMRLRTCQLCGVTMVALLGMPALAQRHEHGERHPRVERWHGDIHQFHQHDYPVWRGGRWFHGPHGGRSGWWWIVGLNWYWYPAPTYPYPDAYLPPPVVATPPPIPGALPHYWYYCADPPGYYPYVPQCFRNWERVPAAP